MKRIEESMVLLNILCLEDDLKDAELLNENLVEDGYLVSMDIANSEKKFTDFLNASNYDLIFAKNSVPQFDALAALKVTLSLKPEIPFICVSGTVGEEKAVELLKQGASDYVIKDRLDRFPFAVRRALKERKMKEEGKKAKEKIQESEKRFKAIFNQAPIAVALLDTDGHTILSNLHLSNMVGYSNDELSKMTFTDFTFHEDADNDINQFKELIGGKISTYSMEKRFVHKNGNIVWGNLFVTLIHNEDGKSKEVIGMAVDITERKRTESELIIAKEKAEESESRLSSVFNSMSEGFSILEVICDDNGQPIDLRFIESNLAFENQTGLKNSATLGHTLLELFPATEPYWIERYGHIGLSGEPMTFDAMFGPLNKYYHCNAFQIKHGFLGTMFTDITERRQAELLIKEKNEALTQINIELIKAKEKAEEGDRLKTAFLTNMSHEIRTPMNGILGFTELLKEPNLSSDDIQDYVQTIQISGGRMLNTINSIIDLSKIESGLTKVDIQETNINDKCEFLYKFFKPEADIKGLQLLFKCGLQSKEAIVNADSEKVYGILTNLVKNAIKFTYDGSIEFGYEKKGNFLEFYVTDTGIGIPDNQKEIIFERFRQGSELYNRGYEGSGLGLSISKSYVEMLGGKIWVECQLPKGSAFYFTIPYNPVLEEKMAIKDALSHDNTEDQINRLKILIVEDDKISSSLLSKILWKISKTIIYANTGLEAVEACRNNPDIDLVLMDIRMPQMDGNEATRQIRLFNKDVIIIAQTAYAFAVDSENAFNAGCNDIISKPIDKVLLLEIIKKNCIKRD